MPESHVDRRAGSVVLCWDIDGTLINTGRAGIGAWEQSVGEIAGYTVDLADLHTAGLTDVEVAEAILFRERIRASRANLERLVGRYESLLPGVLGSRRGHVCAGAREFLSFNERAAWAWCILLTGNTALGARAKLEHYGLASYFREGAFSDLEGRDRASIARRAEVIARRLLLGSFSPERMVVIGDTPHDVACGNAIGARTIAVASGHFVFADLQRSGAWLALRSLPEPQDLVRLIEGGTGSATRALESP